MHCSLSEDGNKTHTLRNMTQIPTLIITKQQSLQFLTSVVPYTFFLIQYSKECVNDSYEVMNANQYEVNQYKVNYLSHEV